MELFQAIHNHQLKQHICFKKVPTVYFELVFVIYVNV